ncbi:Bidirectional sugar transporter SWEET14-like protein, partial [Drosera capensis]
MWPEEVEMQPKSISRAEPKRQSTFTDEAPFSPESLFGALRCREKGNIISFMVYLSPLPTFWRIMKKKSADGFHSIPYSVALFSAMLYLYYAFLKDSNRTMLITINSFGCVVESTYLILYMIYATKQAKIHTGWVLILFNGVVYGLIILFTMLLCNAKQRLAAVGWICGAFSLCVFAAPLSIMRLVIRTKSVEFMPFGLSFTLTLCAVIWFFYGFLIKDFFIAVVLHFLSLFMFVLTYVHTSNSWKSNEQLPNVMGFFLGVAQMILYIAYKNTEKPGILPETELDELPETKLDKLPETKLDKLPIEISLCTIHEFVLKASNPKAADVHVEPRIADMQHHQHANTKPTRFVGGTISTGHGMGSCRN